MLQIICGEKGTGKTKIMLDTANDAVKGSKGDIIYVDKNARHMYNLNNKVRLINIGEYPIESYDGFIGFVAGLLSSNYGIECVLFDSLLKLSHISKDDLEKLLNTLDELSSSTRFILSVSIAEADLPDFAKDKVISSC